jgi:hypothetical protein
MAAVELLADRPERAETYPRPLSLSTRRTRIPRARNHATARVRKATQVGPSWSPRTSTYAMRL